MTELHRTTIHLPPSIIQKVDEIAKVWHCSRNQSIISLLEIALAQDSPTPAESAKQSPDSMSADSEEPSSGSDRE